MEKLLEAGKRYDKSAIALLAVARQWSDRIIEALPNKEHLLEGDISLPRDYRLITYGSHMALAIWDDRSHYWAAVYSDIEFAIPFLRDIANGLVGEIAEYFSNEAQKLEELIKGVKNKEN